MVLDEALDFRHHSVDGRLGYWTVGLVEEYLLVYLPRTPSATAEDAADVPGNLRLLVRYLHVSGLADPTGDPLADLDAAITKVGSGFAMAMSDERNFGLAKFWTMNALRHGVDPTDNAAMNGFLDHVRAGRVDYDQGVLDEIAARHALDSGGSSERAVNQLPVSLPPDTDLAAAAEETPVVTQMRRLTDWVGDGRALTQTGNLTLADARELVTLLDTGDELDRTIGDRVYRTRSSADLPALAQLIELAKRIRVVRVVKSRLVRVAKNASLLRDGLALWTATFDALPSPELVTRGNPWAFEHTHLLGQVIKDVLPDVLNTLYGLPEPMPVVQLTESVWLSLTEAFYLDELDEQTETTWRTGVAADLHRVFVTLAEFGVVELATAEPDPIYRADLEMSPFPPDTSDRLRSALAPGAGPLELVSLTALATRAVRGQLVGAGRSAPLVGELADAEPAPMLGLLSEHYTSEAAAEEIAGWLAAHGGRERGLPVLLDAIRGCPFRTRAAAMLEVLSSIPPDRPAFLRDLRQDRQLGPIATNMLVEDGELGMDELGSEEVQRGMAEQFINLLEISGPDGVAEARSARSPRARLAT